MILLLAVINGFVIGYLCRKHKEHCILSLWVLAQIVTITVILLTGGRK